MPIKYDPAEFGPRAGSLIRALVDEVNSLRSVVDRSRQGNVLEEGIRAVAGLQERTMERVLEQVPTLEQVYTKEDVDAKDEAIKATIPSAVELPQTWVRPVDTTTVKGDRVYAREITEITGTRVSTWTDTATGLLGTASSSRRYKENIRPLDLDALSVLSIEPKWYVYRAEKRKRDDPEYQDYRGEWYSVATEPGMIAEDLHDAGLGAFVVYDKEGQPDGIHYQMWVVALQQVVRSQQEQINNLASRLDALEGPPPAL